jgi:hypothetical protein
MSLSLRIRDRLLRDCVARCMHDWGHALNHASMPIHQALNLPEVRQSTALSAMLSESLAALDLLFRETRELYSGVRSLETEGDVQRLAGTFVLREVVSDSLFPYRQSLKRESIILDEVYKSDLEVAGPEEDFSNVFEALFEYIVGSLIEAGNVSKRMLQVLIRSHNTTREPASFLGHNAVAARLLSTKKGKIRFAECTIHWNGPPMFSEATSPRPRYDQRPPLSNFSILAAHSLSVGVGGDIEFGSGAANTNFVTIRLPAPWRKNVSK